MNNDYEILIRLSLAAVAGLIIGLEREMKHKPAGLKTTLVISIISCLLTIVSIESAYLFPKSTRITMDPLRLAAQIVSGIGFLGAGVILRRTNDTITGLTTAAIMWGAAGLGIAIGAGYYIEALAGIILIIVSIELVPVILGLFGPKTLRQQELSMQVVVQGDIEEAVRHLEQQHIQLYQMQIQDLDNAQHRISGKILVHKNRRITEVYRTIQAIEAVLFVELEN